MWFAKTALAGSLALIAVLSLFATPAEALSRSDGDYWVYEGSMDLEGVSVSGSFRYEFEEELSLAVGPGFLEVNVMRVTGTMTGSMFDLFSLSIEATFDGRTYETKDGLGTWKEEMHMWANTTIGTVFSVVIRAETETVTLYSPPSFSGFDEDETRPGDEWEETTNVVTSYRAWTDGSLEESSTYEHQETLSYSVASSEDRVITPAGTFDCLRISITDDGGDYEVKWYSAEVGNYVKMANFGEGETTPYFSLELTEYDFSKGSVLMDAMILIGVTVLVASLVIVVILFLGRRRGQTPAQVPPEAPPQAHPSEPVRLNPPR